jgi:chorismate mutase/prephenate dehydratase
MKKTDSLDAHRHKIDGIDDKILGLLNDRANVVKEIGRVKAKNGASILSANRESEILNRLMEENRGPLPNESISDIFQTVFTASRALQKRLTISYFGPEATFTHMAAIKHFGRNADYMAVPSITDVFYEVERNRADFGVVPIENSTEGVVNHTLDMFISSDLKIIAEREEAITQNLLSISGNIKAVKSVYSHAQALAQCRKWLDVHLPNATVHEAASTSDAALHATLDASAAAIASQLAAQIYNLKPVATGIEDFSENATRFLIIGKNVAPPTGRDRTSIMFSIKDHVGALYEMLEPFRKAGLNLTKIESRPTKKKAWEYLFFVDFIGHESDKHVQKALDDLQHKVVKLKVLGSYPYGA